MKITRHDYQIITTEIESQKPLFVVNWVVNNVCNFKCSYCIPALNDGTVKGPDLDTIKTFISEIKRQRPDHQIVFEFLGGEFTYHPKCIEIAEYAKLNDCKVCVLTNASKPAKWWNENLHHFDQVIISYHAEFLKEEQLLSVVDSLFGRVQLILSFMMIPERFEEIHSIASRIANTYQDIDINLMPLHGGLTGVMLEYSPDQVLQMSAGVRSEIRDYKKNLPEGFIKSSVRGSFVKKFSDGRKESVQISDLQASKENSWLGWECNIGLEEICVSGEGHIFSSNCSQSSHLGDMNQSNFKLPEVSVICLQQWCRCGTDILVTKKKLYKS